MKLDFKKKMETVLDRFKKGEINRRDALKSLGMMGVAGVAAGCTGSPMAQKQPAPDKILTQILTTGNYDFVDMAQPLNEKTLIIDLPPQFADTPGFKQHPISNYDDKGPAWYWNWFTVGEHVGTHFDAPIHWITGKTLASVDEIPASEFVGEAIVIDLTREAEANPDKLLTVEDIVAFEKRYGQVPPHSWVIMKTGWGKYAQDSKQFFNMGSDGMPHVPGVGKEAAIFLAEQRDVLGVATETVGTDAGIAGTFDPPFPNHTIMHGAGKFGLTQLANVDKLPPRGAILIATPLKMTGGSGSPCRPIAIVPKA